MAVDDDRRQHGPRHRRRRHRRHGALPGLLLTVPGGAVLPMAGITIVGVAPTHRRRGILRTMYTELHNRIADARYPIAGLTASEGGIYGRFGYGPATIEQRVHRRPALRAFPRGCSRPRWCPDGQAGRARRRPRRDLRALAAATRRAASSAPRRCGTKCWPTVNGSAAAEPSGSRSCIPTATSCTECSARRPDVRARRRVHCGDPRCARRAVPGAARSRPDGEGRLQHASC